MSGTAEGDIKTAPAITPDVQKAKQRPGRYKKDPIQTPINEIHNT